MTDYIQYIRYHNGDIYIPTILINALLDNNIDTIKQLLKMNTCLIGEHVLIYALESSNISTIKYIIDYYEKINRKINFKLYVKNIIRMLSGSNKYKILDYLIYLGKHNYNKIITPMITYEQMKHFSIINKGIIFYNYHNENRYIDNNTMFILQNIYIIIQTTDYILCII